MKAAVVTEYGKPIEIAEVDKPSVKDDSVIVEIHAASINPIDYIIRDGHMKGMLPYELPWTIGYDLSGVVTEVGSDVSTLNVGDEVFGRADGMQAGTLAEFAVIKASDLAIKPPSITHAEAASIPLAGLTAWQALTVHGDLQAGQKILIHAGSGGVGTLAIQLAKSLGAFVATTTSESNKQLVTDLGADLVIDYKTQKFEDEISDYDMVFDMMGGDTLKRSFAVVKDGGTIVSIKGDAPDDMAEKTNISFAQFFMNPSGEQLTKLADMISAGTLRAVIDETFPLDQVNAAYDKLEDGHASGKIAIAVR